MGSNPAARTRKQLSPIGDGCFLHLEYEIPHVLIMFPAASALPPVLSLSSVFFQKSRYLFAGISAIIPVSRIYSLKNHYKSVTIPPVLARQIFIRRSARCSSLIATQPADLIAALFGRSLASCAVSAANYMAKFAIPISRDRIFYFSGGTAT